MQKQANLSPKGSTGRALISPSNGQNKSYFHKKQSSFSQVQALISKNPMEMVSKYLSPQNQQ